VETLDTVPPERFSARVVAGESYRERLPVPGLAGVVRTVWIQSTGPTDHVHRHLPSGGVEIHFPIGGRPQLLGPLTGPAIDIIPANTTLVGVRFHPGTAPPLPAMLDDLVDQQVGLAELWGHTADRLVEAMAQATTPERALTYLQAHLLNEFRTSGRLDPVVNEAVRALMPWQPVNIDRLAAHLALSGSQLRRRCLHTVGTTPKVLQRTLRFQGFLALAQSRAASSDRRGPEGVAGLALEVGYADQAHLNRECLRLSGLTPGQLVEVNLDHCAREHDHTGSYLPFLATRGGPPLRL
jgi:AraC-like DNA-binding protein